MSKEDEMLVELRKIREAVEKAPPPQPPKGLWREFIDFLSKYKVIGLAVAFVIGLYLGRFSAGTCERFVVAIDWACYSRAGRFGHILYSVRFAKVRFG